MMKVFSNHVRLDELGFSEPGANTAASHLFNNEPDELLQRAHLWLKIGHCKMSCRVWTQSLHATVFPDRFALAYHPVSSVVDEAAASFAKVFDKCLEIERQVQSLALGWRKKASLLNDVFWFRNPLVREIFAWLRDKEINYNLRHAIIRDVAWRMFSSRNNTKRVLEDIFNTMKDVLRQSKNKRVSRDHAYFVAWTSPYLDCELPDQTETEDFSELHDSRVDPFEAPQTVSKPLVYKTLKLTEEDKETPLSVGANHLNEGKFNAHAHQPNKNLNFDFLLPTGSGYDALDAKAKRKRRLKVKQEMPKHLHPKPAGPAACKREITATLLIENSLVDSHLEVCWSSNLMYRGRIYKRKSDDLVVASYGGAKYGFFGALLDATLLAGGITIYHYDLNKPDPLYLVNNHPAQDLITQTKRNIVFL
jgi:hypothetical protein